MTAMATSISSAVVVRPSDIRSAPARLLVGVAHRREHVAHLERAGRAGRADRGGDPLEIEGEGDGRAIGVVDDDRQEAGQPIARDVRSARPRRRRGLRRAAGCAGRRRGPRSAGARRTRARRRSPSPRRRPTFSVPARRFRSCDPPCCWASRCVPCRTYRAPIALGSLELVGGEADQVDAERLEVEVDPRRRLDRVDVEEDAAPGPDALGDLGDRLDRADLVVGEHDADQDRPVGDRGVDLVRVDPAVAVDRQLDDLEARTSRGSAGVWLTAWCSIELVTIRWPRALPAHAPPLRARLFASVPPDVKTISRGWAPRRAASRSCASSSAARARRPSACADDGLPKTLGQVRQHRLERPPAGPASWRRGRGRSSSAGLYVPSPDPTGGHRPAGPAYGLGDGDGAGAAGGVRCAISPAAFDDHQRSISARRWRG